jgi:hypothetical protein
VPSYGTEMAMQSYMSYKHGVTRAPAESVIACPSPLNVLIATHDRSFD